MHSDAAPKITDSLERSLVERSLADHGPQAFAHAAAHPWMQALVVILAAGVALALL